MRNTPVCLVFAGLALGIPPAVPEHWLPTVPCLGDTDCVLNGVCTAGACACDPGWEGVSCDRLALHPAPDLGAYGYSPNISSSWGASVVKVDGQYHMYVSEFNNGCGLTSWQHNSHIVHATAATAAGPFEYSDTVLGTFSHNPKVLAGERERLLLFHVGDGGPYPPQSQCGGGTRQPMCTGTSTLLRTTSEECQRDMPPHTRPCDALFSLPMLIGCGTALAIRVS